MPQISLIQNVVVYQGGNMDEFHDDRERDMFFCNAASGSACQKREAWTQPLACSTQDVLDILAKTRIKTADLGGQCHLHARQFSRNRFQQFQKVSPGTRCVGSVPAYDRP